MKVRVVVDVWVSDSSDNVYEDAEYVGRQVEKMIENNSDWIAWILTAEEITL